MAILSRLERVLPMSKPNASGASLGIAFDKHRMDIRPISLIIGFFCLLFANSVTATSADSIQSREYRIKAAVIYKLLKFVEWPDESLQNGSPLGLCIVGNDPFGSFLETLNGRLIHGVSLNVTHLVSGQRLDHCQAVFIAEPDDRELNRFLDQVSNRPLLTISETNEFIQKGGMIGLFTKNNRVQFKINVNNTKNNGLSLSFQLLRLAHTVIQ